VERIREALDKAERQSQKAKTPISPGLTGQSPSRPSMPGGNMGVCAHSIASLRPDQTQWERHRIVAHDNRNPYCADFDLLRTKILHRMVPNKWRTLGVVSAEPGAGKTVIAINLAMSIARLPERTSLLLDFDMRRPRIANYLGVEPEMSLDKVLEGKCNLKEAVFRTQLDGFFVACQGNPVANSCELLSSSTTKRIIEQTATSQTECIQVIDLPPLLSVDDGLSIMPWIDCVVLVVEDRISSSSNIKESLRLLSTTNLVGTILNKSPDSKGLIPYEY
jgi:protein-tyrosine kinase